MESKANSVWVINGAISPSFLSAVLALRSDFPEDHFGGEEPKELIVRLHKRYSYFYNRLHDDIHELRDQVIASGLFTECSFREGVKNPTLDRSKFVRYSMTERERTTIGGFESLCLAYNLHVTRYSWSTVGVTFPTSPHPITGVLQAACFNSFGELRTILQTVRTTFWWQGRYTDEDPGFATVRPSAFAVVPEADGRTRQGHPLNLGPAYEY